MILYQRGCEVAEKISQGENFIGGMGWGGDASLLKNNRTTFSTGSYEFSFYDDLELIPWAT